MEVLKRLGNEIILRVLFHAVVASLIIIAGIYSYLDRIPGSADAAVGLLVVGLGWLSATVGWSIKQWPRLVRELTEPLPKPPPESPRHIYQHRLSLGEGILLLGGALFYLVLAIVGLFVIAGIIGL